MKKYRPIDKQIEILQYNHNLTINQANKQLSHDELFYYGYHEIINGYQNAFMMNDAGQQIFDKDTRFEQLSELFRFDANIRAAIRASADFFELTFKAALSRNIAREYGTKESSYLEKTNFNPGKKNNKGRNSRDWLFEQINRLKKNKDDLLVHHKEKGEIPPWILVKFLSLGASKEMFVLLSNSSLKNAITKDIISAEFIDSYGLERAKNFLTDLINLIQTFRNRSSHSNRTYDFYQTGRNVGIKNFTDLLKSKAFTNDELENVNFNKGIGAIMIGLQYINNPEPFNVLSNNISAAINSLFTIDNNITDEFGNHKITEGKNILLEYVVRSMHMPYHFDLRGGTRNLVIGTFA